MAQTVWELIYNNPDTTVAIASSRPIKRKIGSDLIMWYQKTNYSHVIVIIEDMVYQASHGYANTIPFKEFLKNNMIVDLVEIEKEKCDFEYLYNTLGTKYGYAQLFKVAMKFITITKLKMFRNYKYKDNGNKYVICSEYMGKFLKLDWVNDLTDPRDIIKYLLTIKKK